MVELRKAISRRATIWAGILWGRTLAIIAGLWLVAQVWDTVSAQIVERWVDDPPLIVDALVLAAGPPWFIWTIIALALLLGVVLEGAYRMITASQAVSGEAQEAIAKMSSETKRAFLKMREALRTSYVSGASSQRPHLEKLRLLVLVDVSREDAGYWSTGRHKGMIDIFRLTALGGIALDILEADDVEVAIAKLSEQARTYLFHHGQRVASAVDALEIGQDVRNELTLAGITESEIVPISDSLTGAGTSKEVWKLTPFGKEVARCLRDQTEVEGT